MPNFTFGSALFWPLLGFHVVGFVATVVADVLSGLLSGPANFRYERKQVREATRLRHWRATRAGGFGGPSSAALSEGARRAANALAPLVEARGDGMPEIPAADLARMQADFISHVSHQLKTPLSLLSAAAETLSMDRVRSPEKMAQYLGTIRGQVMRLSALVQRILEFSRLQQPRSYEFEEIELGLLVRETVAAFQGSLSGQFTVIAWDAPGAGRSPDPPETFGIRDWADCLAAFLDAVGIQRPHILGLSWGGLLAQEFYRRHAARVRSLVLADTYAGWKGSLSAPIPEERLAACLRDASLPPAEFVPRYLPGMFSPSPRPEVRDELARIMSDFHPLGFRLMATALARADTRDLLPTIQVPTLLVWGDADVFQRAEPASEAETPVTARARSPSARRAAASKMDVIYWSRSARPDLESRLMLRRFPLEAALDHSQPATSDAPTPAEPRTRSRSLMRQALSADLLANPTGAIGAITSNLSVDEQLTNDRMRSLAFEMRNLRPNNIEFITAPIDQDRPTGSEGCRSRIGVSPRRRSPIAGRRCVIRITGATGGSTSGSAITCSAKKRLSVASETT